MASFALTWLFLAGLYLAFTGQVSAAELAVALSGGLAAAAYRLVSGRSGRAFSSGFLAGMELSPRVVVSICCDVGKLTVAFLRLVVMARSPRGTFVDIAFDPGRGDPRSRRRRSLVVTGISFAPNTFVVAVRRPQGQLTLHALLPPPPRDMRWPL